MGVKYVYQYPMFIAHSLVCWGLIMVIMKAAAGILYSTSTLLTGLAIALIIYGFHFKYILAWFFTFFFGVSCPGKITGIYRDIRPGARNMGKVSLTVACKSGIVITPMMPYRYKDRIVSEDCTVRVYKDRFYVSGFRCGSKNDCIFNVM
ncbi:MAG: hypothetical protein IJ806_02765 [Ruminococcus sp.]|nr:hypothetical protein [Ruminococcus sp.]